MHEFLHFLLQLDFRDLGSSVSKARVIRKCLSESARLFATDSAIQGFIIQSKVVENKVIDLALASYLALCHQVKVTLTRDTSYSG